MMEDFGTILDEFIDDNKKSTRTTPLNYEALLCDPGWFISNKQQYTVQLINTKFKADYLYMTGKYKESIESYDSYINESPNISLTLKRECLEGISRSYLAIHCYCDALKCANELRPLSSTFESLTVTLTLSLDCCLNSKRYNEAVTLGQKLVTLHCLNSDVWLKLGYAYAGLYDIALTINLCSLSNTKCCSENCECVNASKEHLELRDIDRVPSFVVSCLLHAEFHLISVAKSASGFALKHNLDLQERIKKNVENFDFDSKDIEAIRDYIKMKYTEIKQDKDCGNEEFVDRGSSKFKNKQHVNCILEESNCEVFQGKWFM